MLTLAGLAAPLSCDPGPEEDGGEATTGSDSDTTATTSGEAVDPDWGDCTYDPGLKQNIQLHLKAHDYASVLDIPHLVVDDYRYDSLQGIECLSNLATLELSYYFAQEEVPVVDLTPLAQLEHLSTLVIGDVTLTHLEALQEPPLTTLTLRRIEADSFAPLGGLTQLEQLEMYALALDDLSCLTGLGELQTLWLRELPAKNLEALAHLPRLADLWIEELPVEDLDGLIDLPQLHKLRLWKTPLTSLQGLAQVPNLRELIVLDSPDIESLDGVEQAPALENLGLSGGSPMIIDLGPLSALSELQSFALEGSLVEDLGVLADCPHLEHLELDGNQVSDLTPLSSLQLQVLSLSDNQVTSIAALEGMPLTLLSLDRNPVSSLDPLRSLSELTWLSINDVGADSLDMLPSISGSYGFLSARDNSISDLSPIAAWTNINLDLANNEVVELPEGFVGAQGFCQVVDLRENPLSESAQSLLEDHCATNSGSPSYQWDGGSCQDCITR